MNETLSETQLAYLHQLKQPREVAQLKKLRSEEQFDYLGDEYVQFDQAYDLRNKYQITFGMFITKPWYYRIFVELLEDAASVRTQPNLRPLLEQQKAAAVKFDRAHLRPETRTRLHNGAIFEPLHHHRHPRRGLSAFFRRQP